MRFLIAAGGTGGHINPALAVAGYLKNKYLDSEILFVGTKNRMESRLVPDAGFEIKTVKITGFQRRISFSSLKNNLKTVTYLISSSREAKKIIKDFSPDVAIGFGGYVSGPVIRMAAKLKIKTIIHEQNAYPGVTNKALAGKVDRVLLTSEDAKKYMKPKNEPIVTGLPVRGELFSVSREEARKKLGFDSRPVILSIGGSLGAEPINKAVTEMILNDAEKGEYYHVHAMGNLAESMREELKSKGFTESEHDNVMLFEYIKNMADFYAACDLVIARSGASTLSELQALGKPSILIPSPYVTENHQYHNAMAMVNRDAAVLIEQKNLTGKTLSDEAYALINDKERLERLARNAKNMAIQNSTERIGEIAVYFAKQNS